MHSAASFQPDALFGILAAVSLVRGLRNGLFVPLPPVPRGEEQTHLRPRQRWPRSHINERPLRVKPISGYFIHSVSLSIPSVYISRSVSHFERTGASRNISLTASIRCFRVNHATQPYNRASGRPGFSSSTLHLDLIARQSLPPSALTHRHIHHAYSRGCQSRVPRPRRRHHHRQCRQAQRHEPAKLLRPRHVPARD